MTALFDYKTADLDQIQLIEASAGTGKTFSLTRVVLRLLVEKAIPIESILMVTFTVASTAETRNRMRELLTNILGVLTTKVESPASSPSEKLTDDEAMVETWALEGRDLKQFIVLVKRALKNLDNASIYTIHGFCQRMMSEFALSNGINLGTEIGEDDAIIDQLISDFVERQSEIFQKEGRTQWLKLLKQGPWHSIYRAYEKAYVNAHWYWSLDPDWIEDNPQPVDWDDFVDSVRPNFETFVVKQVRPQKDRLGLMTFDDILRIMAEKVDSTDGEFARNIRRRFNAVLVDEFQDTDPLQYKIFKTLFIPTGNDTNLSDYPSCVIFVGDPKQSIYRFRNADLEVYFEAKRDIGADHIRELRSNWRSTPLLLCGINAFFNQVPNEENLGSFLNKKLAYSCIEAKGNAEKLKLTDKDGKQKPVFELWFTYPNNSYQRYQGKEGIAEKVAYDIERLLKGNLILGDRPLRANDIAVLVSKRKDADLLIDKLKALGIRSLIKENVDVFQSDEALEILVILQALEHSEDIGLVTQAAATRLIGFDLEAIKSSDSIAIAETRRTLELALKDFESISLMATLRKLIQKTGLLKRLSSQLGGERRWTNYNHILEELACHCESFTSIAAVIRWLTREMQNSNEERTPRLESEADLVNIVTIHASKGLQYPIVYVLPINPNRGQATVSHLGNKEILISFNACTDNGSKQFEKQEQVRLAYVAMTRATSRLVLPLLTEGKKNNCWSTTANNTYFNSLAMDDSADLYGSKLLLGETTNSLNKRIDELFEKEQFPATSRQLIQIVPKDPKEKDRPNDPTNKDSIEPLPCEQTLCFEEPQPVCSTWDQTSFTHLTRHSESSMEEFWADEADQAQETRSSIPSKLPAGTSFGIFMHSLFENINYETVRNNDRVTIRKELMNQVATRPWLMTNATKEEVVEALLEMIFNVLQASIETNKEGKMLLLADLEPTQMAHEVPFSLSIDAKNGRPPLTVRTLAQTLNRFGFTNHGLSPTTVQSLKGYLVGAIDLLFEFEGQYWILDWKSNLLKTSYNKESMEKAMQEHNYHLQYLLYAVALYRRLQLQQDSNIAEKLGGAIYVFTRGVNKTSEDGIYMSRPSPALIACINELMNQGYDESIVEKYLKEVE